MKKPKRKPTNWAKPKPKTERTPNVNSWLYQKKYWKRKKVSFWSKPENQYCAKCKTPVIWVIDGKTGERRPNGFYCDHVDPVPIGCSESEFEIFTENHKLQALCVHCNAVKTAKDKWKKN